MARSKSKSYLWDGLNRQTAKLYALIAASWPGRMLTGYRKLDAAFAKGRRYTGRHRCTPMSPARLRLLNAVESGKLFKGIRGLSRFLFCMPMALYGLFFLIYGLLGVGCYFVLPRVYPSLTPDFEHALISGIITLLAVPLVLTKKTLAETLGSGALSHLIFVRFLGIPQDRLEQPRQKVPVALPYLTLILAIAAAGGALLTHPLLIPGIMMALGGLGLIMTYPEAGVVLSTVMLPAIWLDRNLLIPLCGLILMTWLSYGVKMLFLHRTIRFGMLDTVLLIFGFLILFSGFTGAAVTHESILTSVMLFICLSDYFLIVNLMNTRAHIRRCLVGVGLSVVVVTLLSYLRNLPTDGLAWLEGSRAGNAIVEGFSNGMDRLSGLWTEHSEIYLVLVFSWLYAYMLHTKRPIRKIMGGIFILLDFALVLMSGSITALFCVLGITVLFLLMLGHKSLSACLIAALPMGCGIYWLGYLYPVSDALRTILSRSRLYKAQLWDSQWAMVLDYPGGIGVGEASFAAVYPAYAAPDLGAVTGENNLLFEILLSYGWIGLLLMSVVLFLFVQKGLTCLRHTVVPSERAMILGGVTGLIGMVIFGTMRSFITSPRVFFTLLLVVALCSAYENVIFNESDIRAVEWAGSEQAEDRFYRSGDFKK
jgi:hypothetical protein